MRIRFSCVRFLTVAALSWDLGRLWACAAFIAVEAPRGLKPRGSLGWGIWVKSALTLGVAVRTLAGCGIGRRHRLPNDFAGSQTIGKLSPDVSNRVAVNRRLGGILNLSPVNQPFENHRVLCVLVDPDELPDAVRARLCQEDIDLDHRPDVFRGLARVGEWQPSVIILGADWLTPDESGFFDHVRRTAPMARLFIFGTEQRAGSAYLTLAAMGDVQPIGLEALHDALRAGYRRWGVAGADQSTTTEKIRGSDPDSVAPPPDVLNASLEVSREPTAAADSTNEHDEAPANAVDPFDGVELDVFADDEEIDGDAFDVGEDFEDDEQLCEDEDATETLDDDSQPVRVPWLRYNERPKRIPPSKAAPPRSATDRGNEDPNRLTDSTGVNGDDIVDDDPPLLSTEELEALLGEGPIE